MSHIIRCKITHLLIASLHAHTLACMHPARSRFHFVFFNSYQARRHASYQTEGTHLVYHNGASASNTGASV